MKKHKFPLCRKYGLLRSSRMKDTQIVSSSALHKLLGETIYQRVRPGFDYDGNTGPLPASVELFLLTDKEAQQKLKQQQENNRV